MMAHRGLAAANVAWLQQLRPDGGQPRPADAPDGSASAGGEPAQGQFGVEGGAVGQDGVVEYRFG